MDDLDLKGYGRWGRSLGEYHNASAGYRDDRIPSWKDHITTIRRVLPASEVVVLRELDSVEASMECLHVDDANYGLVHYDFELDNIRWNDGVPGLMDFDDFVYMWYAADMIIGISELYEDSVDRIDLEDERFQAFLRGYRSVRPLSDETLANLPLFLRFDSLYGYSRIYRSTEEGPIEGEPQWTTDLRDKLQKHNRKLVEELSR